MKILKKHTICGFLRPFLCVFHPIVKYLLPFFCTNIYIVIKMKKLKEPVLWSLLIWRKLLSYNEEDIKRFISMNLNFIQEDTNTCLQFLHWWGKKLKAFYMILAYEKKILKVPSQLNVSFLRKIQKVPESSG